MHPALLDVATGFAVLDQHYDAALLPFGYGRLRLHAPLPPRVFSELQALRETGDGLSLDLRIVDPQGRCWWRSRVTASAGQAACQRPRTSLWCSTNPAGSTACAPIRAAAGRLVRARSKSRFSLPD